MINDNSEFVLTLLDEKYNATLLLRPKVWGKSSFLNMLEKFHDINTDKLELKNQFNHLKIFQKI